MKINIGVDVGGTKLLAAALSETDEILHSVISPTPRFDYELTIQEIVALIGKIETSLQITAPVGIGMPGSIAPNSRLVQNANSTWLNGRDFITDLKSALSRDIRWSNDANCFSLSESTDGAAAGAHSVFGVIMGTGVGGGLVLNGNLINGPRSIGGEWGHCSLPFADKDEFQNAALCWCGQKGCIESWISGPAILHHHNLTAKAPAETTEQVVTLAGQGNFEAKRSLDAHTKRTAKALAMVVNIFDPEVIVLGGGLSELEHLYDKLPALMAPYIFADAPMVDIRRPLFGASSGVRGAARLWEF